MTDKSPILARVAAALGIPVEMFSAHDNLSGDQRSSFLENVELLEAFQRIGDRQARRRCVSYVKATADRCGSVTRADGADEEA